MSTPTQHDMLMTALEQVKNQSFSVTSIRDLITEINPDQEFKSAELRRWVNGKFKTLLKKGYLKLMVVEGSKRPRYASTQLFKGSEGAVVKLPSVLLEDGMKAELARQAQEYHRKLNIQLGEIAEYQRLSDEYPNLKLGLDKKTTQLTEENHRLLGRLKALEETLYYQRSN